MISMNGVSTFVLRFDLGLMTLLCLLGLLASGTCLSM